MRIHIREHTIMHDRYKLARLTLMTLAMVSVSVLAPSASATSPQPVAWSYPALQGLCLLEAAAALDGVSAAYPIGQIAVTKGGKWVCAEVITRQVPMTTGGVWVRVR